ncbi:hypothetical protein ACW0JT_15395 [Arthrobacter sp. SA17]
MAENGCRRFQPKLLPWQLPYESAFTNPLDSRACAYGETVKYVTALPETSGISRAGLLRAWFLGRVEMLKDGSLRQSEIDYIHVKCAHAALQISFYRGRLGLRLAPLTSNDKMKVPCSQQNDRPK